MPAAWAVASRTGVPAVWAPSRGMAKKPPKKGAEVAAPKQAADYNPDVVTGLNVFKDGKDILPGILAGGKDPEIRPDSEYPDWVFKLHEPLPTLDELKKKYKEQPENFSEEDTQRLIKKWNLDRIRKTKRELATKI